MVVLNDLPVEKALEMICRAADATFRREGGVYYIFPRPN